MSCQCPVAPSVTWAVEQILIERFGREIPRPGLQRVGRLYRSLFSAATRPAPTNVAVMGTNGKGSTVAALDFACRSIGLRTLAFTSPHLLDVRERITLSGAFLSEAFWIASLDELGVRSRGLGISLSYFEAVFGVALLAALTYKPDVILWEAGLGGRLDAINAMPSFDCVVLSSVGLDHCEILGPTALDIAREKLALARHLTPLVVGDVQTDVMEAVYPELQAQRALVISAQQALPPAWVRQPSQLQRQMPWLTMDSARAIIWALVALDRWAPGDLDWTQMVAPRGRMDRSRWPWLVDVGHNPDAARSACRALVQAGAPPMNLCFNALQRKDALAMAEVLAHGYPWSRVWLYDDGARDFHPVEPLAEVFRRAGCQVDTINDPRFFAGVPERPTFVLGSFRLAALILQPSCVV